MSFEDFQDGYHGSHLSWISEGSDFGNSESLCPFDASHQLLAQSDLVLEEMSFEDFQDGCYGGILEQNDLCNSESPCCPNTQLNPTDHSRHKWACNWIL